MINDKILIFAPYKYGINNGGPSGFIAHNLADKPRDLFILSNDFFEKEPFFTKLDRRIYSFFHKDNFFSYYYKKIKAHNYKYIYFHDCLSFEHCREFIPENQVVILQSHSPELPSKEYANLFPDNITEIEKLIKAEKNAFDRANIVVFPNEACVKLYEGLLNKNSEIHYILSGAKKVSYNNLDRKELDNNKINLLYIGRRNEVKGFDIVLDTFKKATQHRKDLNLYIIGKGNKIESENIIDIGFSKEPLIWYNSVDYLINANRSSYFDLSIIEALSTGVPIIMSDNFGHQYYRNKSPLIRTFDAFEQDALLNILKGNLEKRNYSNTENFDLYENELTDDYYYKRFIEFAHNILKN